MSKTITPGKARGSLLEQTVQELQNKVHVLEKDKRFLEDENRKLSEKLSEYRSRHRSALSRSTN